MKLFSNTRLSFKMKRNVVVCIILAAVFLEVWHYSDFIQQSTSPKNDQQNQRTHFYQVLSTVGNETSSIRPVKQSQVQSRCTPHNHFVYVKTHKTGSTTVHNVFSRYIYKHKLKLPVKSPPPFVGGYPGRIQKRFIFKQDTPDHLQAVEVTEESVVIKDHFRLNATSLKEFMPNDTLFISVVRKPWNQFQSSFYYYYNWPNYKKLSRSNCFHYPYFHIARGLKISMLDFLNLAVENLNESVPWYFRSKNYQSHDLGLDPSLDDDVEIDKEVKKLGSEIDLMLITEYMDESMILLKEKFCMNWNDISFTDEGKHHRYNSFKAEDPQVIRKFRKLYKLDIALYEYFNATLWNKVDEYGRGRMYNDVTALRQQRSDFIAKQRDKERAQVGARSVLSRKTLSADAPLKEMNERTFLAAQNHYDKASMLKILRVKLAHQQPLLTKEQVDDMSEYMVDNYGGCPV